MKSLALVLLLVTLAVAVDRLDYKVKVHKNTLPVITQGLIDTVNAKATWIAGPNKGSLVDGATMDQARALMGFKKGGPKLPEQVHASTVISTLPTSFSAITQWPQCPSIAFIRDQSACGSCYAFAAVEAMSDRICINLNKNISLSAGDVAFCCDSCGSGCGGGYPSSVWEHWKQKGVVEEPCYPYPLPGCNHHEPGTKKMCPPNEYSSPACPSKCTNKTWNGPAYSSDRHKGKSAYSLNGVNQIMADIMKFGSVEAGFQVYEDFLTYRSGVYSHQTGEMVGGHAVKILGWGEDSGTPYWIIANSWNSEWGNNGFFWMLRGQDECGIEDSVVAGLPLN